MRWLVDGYNVIRRHPVLRGREAEGLAAGRTALLHRLAAVARDREETFVVVFDGARLRADGDTGATQGGRVEVVFSRAPETADDVLRRLAERWRDAAVVVSSDRAVETAARRAGAVAVTVEAFVAAVAAGARADDDEGEDDDEDERDTPTKRGNPRRASREERASRRVLRRLR
jgi:predicted RNA-binding protein with PIN domain